MLAIKKTLQHPRADQEKRSAFCQTLEALISQKRPIIFIDESGFAHDMPRTHGYAKKGKRCYGTHDWGAKGRTNVIGALLGKVLLTVTLITSSVNAVIFNAWVEQDLIPKLPTNSVIVMDNATFHKSHLLEPMITAAGHQLLYLPPYSPDFNPIEKKWAKAKKIRRKSQCPLDDLFVMVLWPVYKWLAIAREACFFLLFIKFVAKLYKLIGLTSSTTQKTCTQGGD